MTVLLGLLAAVMYGVSDFAAAVASRRQAAVTVLLTAYPIGSALMLVMLPLAGGTLTTRAFWCGVGGGVAGIVGVAVMYALMAVAPINVISPVTAVLAAAVPVVVGIGLNQHPSALAWTGMVIGLVAVVLVSRTPADHPHGRIRPVLLAAAVLAGFGFGMYFVFLARAGAHSGLWPLVISRLASAVLVAPIALARKEVARIRRGSMWLVLITAVCDPLANYAFLEASRHGLLAVASVLTALYPATTVLLAMVVLHERAGRVQTAGLLLAAAAVVMITL